MEFVLYEQKGKDGIITINHGRTIEGLNSFVLEELEGT